MRVFSLTANQSCFPQNVQSRPLDIDDIERASSYMVYTRAYDNISKIDPNKS
jgi:hypothetical protein